MQKIAGLVLASALLMPTLAGAMGCGADHQQAAVSCAEGMVYDQQVGKCINPTG